MEAKRKDQFELAADTRILINVIEKGLIKEKKEMLTYAEMSAAIGRDVQNESRGNLETARKHVAKNNRVITATIRNVGIRLTENFSGVLSFTAKKMRDCKRRDCKLVQNAIIDKELPPEERVELMAQFSRLECAGLFIKSKISQRLLECIKERGPKELPTAETLKLFA